MQTVAAHATLSGRKTNRSARKTSVEILCRNNLPDSMVMQLTGHRSLNAYKKLSLEQQEEMSRLLSHYLASTEIVYVGGKLSFHHKTLQNLFCLNKTLYSPHLS